MSAAAVPRSRPLTATDHASARRASRSPTTVRTSAGLLRDNVRSTGAAFACVTARKQVSRSPSHRQATTLGHAPLAQWPAALGKRCRRRLNLQAAVGGAVVLKLIVAAPAPPTSRIRSRRRCRPVASRENSFRPDRVGRDILSRIAFSARTSLAAAATTVPISEAIGVGFGSSISFLGLGRPPEIPTRGGMLADGRERHVAMARILSWARMAVPGPDLIGDAPRNILDSRRKRAGSGINQRPGNPNERRKAAWE